MTSRTSFKRFSCSVLTASLVITLLPVIINENLYIFRHAA
ncbi:hypothetical protein HMPREF1574_00865 [Gardnerella pickettii JCP7659]|nr:hypothetical protein HMPREF1574_00865 [Gardnerella pickettii JCP7659]